MEKKITNFDELLEREYGERGTVERENFHAKAEGWTAGYQEGYRDAVKNMQKEIKKLLKKLEGDE